MITYETIIEVYLDGKKVGVIKEKNKRFTYYPKGDKKGGTNFLSLEECKKSLEC